MEILIGALHEVSDAQLYTAALWIAENHRHAPVPSEIKERSLFVRDQERKQAENGRKYITYWERPRHEREAIDAERKACMDKLKKLGMSGIFSDSNDPFEW